MLWLYEAHAVDHAAERLLPTGTVELVINLREDQPDFRLPVVAGPHSESTILDTRHTLSVIGVHFRPGGAFPFLGMPASELHNQEVALDTLWGARAAELRERLLATRGAEARLSMLERALVGVARTAGRHPAVAFAVSELTRAAGTRSIGSITDAIGLSPRHFIARFRDEVGLTPKLFARVQRFQQVVRTVHGAKGVDWLDVALGCGYYDQAHFINDFRAFSGFTPSAYLARKGDHQNHVPL